MVGRMCGRQLLGGPWSARGDSSGRQATAGGQRLAGGRSAAGCWRPGGWQQLAGGLAGNGLFVQDHRLGEVVNAMYHLRVLPPSFFFSGLDKAQAMDLATSLRRLTAVGPLVQNTSFKFALRMRGALESGLQCQLVCNARQSVHRFRNLRLGLWRFLGR